MLVVLRVVVLFDGKKARGKLAVSVQDGSRAKQVEVSSDVIAVLAVDTKRTPTKSKDISQCNAPQPKSTNDNKMTTKRRQWAMVNTHRFS